MNNLNIENETTLDVVDASDSVVNSKPRHEVHQLGLLHREVHVWMFDKDHNIFFQQRGLPVSSPGLLDATAGGHVNAGEEYLDAALRESKEETGYSLFPANLVLLKKLKISNTSKNVHGGPINNFIRSIYIHKSPIDQIQIKREKIPGLSFKKFSIEFLSNPDKEDAKMFDKFILTDELPEVLKYIKDLNS